PSSVRRAGKNPADGRAAAASGGGGMSDGVAKIDRAFFFKQKTAYEITRWLEFRRVLFRSWRPLSPSVQACVATSLPHKAGTLSRSEERRVGQEWRCRSPGSHEKTE